MRQRRNNDKERDYTTKAQSSQSSEYFFNQELFAPCPQRS